jgi:hypothetical protein
MSHGGGVGINYAVQDAIVGANFLTTPLLGGRVMTGQLEAIQGKRAPCGLFKAFKRSVRSG